MSSEDAKKSRPASPFPTEVGDDGQEYIPVSRLIEPDADGMGKAWPGYPVPLRDSGSLPVAACALTISATAAGIERVKIVTEASEALEALRAEKPFPMAKALEVSARVAREAFAHYSPETLEQELLPRVDVSVASLIIVAMLGQPRCVRVAKTQAPASPPTKTDAGAN